MKKKHKRKRPWSDDIVEETTLNGSNNRITNESNKKKNDSIGKAKSNILNEALTTTSLRWSKHTTFPYEVDYNDHFETPREAYIDILPLLQLVAPAPSSQSKSAAKTNITNPTKEKNLTHPDTRTSSHILYDPYYCNGRTKQLLESSPFNFSNVQHCKRDFYCDIKTNKVPYHNTLVTNPPYSLNHKEKCLHYATTSLRNHGRSFFLLMPNYVVTKEYYRKTTFVKCDETGSLKEADDIFYVIPVAPYEYDHPEGTGKEIPPFTSMWFCGIGSEYKERAKSLYSSSRMKDNTSERKVTLACSIDELISMGIIRDDVTTTRPNPRQRRRMRQRAMQQVSSKPGGNTETKGAHKVNTSSPSKLGNNSLHTKDYDHNNKNPKMDVATNHLSMLDEENETRSNTSKTRKKQSKYRNEAGRRNKRRF